jgi:phenylpropionate dioxygenase-like ring-hydroxylating dioxygenase large terminal subunit
MDRSLELELLDEAILRLGQRRADTVERTATLPMANYVDPARLARERDVLFRRGPIAVGFSSQVSEPGRFITHGETDVPILVVRDRDGVLRAFVNACRHRGTLIEASACGTRDAFVCPYHAWTYDLAGCLRGVPHTGGFPELVRAERGLHELPVAECGGLVFVVPTHGATLDLNAFLGPFASELSVFASHVMHAPSRRIRRMNWKLVMDSSYETYHFRTVHEHTIYPMFHDNAGVFAWHDPHCRVVIPKRSISSLAGRPRDTWRMRDHCNILYGIFPNTTLLVQPDHAMVVKVWPIDVDTCVLAAAMLIPEPATSESAERHWRRNEQIFWDAVEEDIAATERIQRTMRAVPGNEVLLGTYEHLLARFHAAIARRLGTD